jgi:hypothetical protein
MRLLAIGTALTLSLAVWYGITHGIPSPESATSSTSTRSTVPTRTVPKGMHEYKDTEFNFSLLYPETLSANKRAEGGGAVTIIFQSIEKSQGFQIFITPFSEVQISEERFRQDIPSGIRNSPEQIMIDGVAATAFYSKDANLGETREVWFIYQGFLYELTVPKPLEGWFRDILQTWEFTNS